MRMLIAREKCSPGFVSWRAVAGACALAVMVILAASPEKAMAEDAPEQFSVSISLPDGKQTFHRGGLEPSAPVDGLIITVTVTNTFGDLPVTLPKPELAAHNGVTLAKVGESEVKASTGLVFDVHLLGAPTGVRRTDKTPERTLIPRTPLAVPLTGLGPPPAVTLGPGESKGFPVNVGSWYGIRKAGRYEMSCMFNSKRSNVIKFEVIPLKVVNERARTLLARVEDFERGGEDYPFMFYVVHGDGRFDEVVYRVRRGSGADEHYEYHRLAEIAPKTVPQMVTDSEKPGRVGLLVPDKRNDKLSRIFTVDLGVLPMRVSGKEVGHEAGSPPRLTLDDLESTR